MKKRSIKNVVTNTKDTVNLVMPGMLSYIQYSIDPFLALHPYWGLAVYAVIGLYGVYLTLTQEALNEVIVFIKDHPKEFRQEIVESEEFRLGFIRFFDSYIKERLKNKRRILRAILLGFVLSEDKEKFDLERLEDALVRISPNGLEHLIFIKNKILPILHAKVAKNISHSEAILPEDYEKVEDFYWAIQSVSDEVIWWFHKNNPSEKLDIELKSKTNKDSKITGKAFITNSKNEDLNKAKESWPELQSLGIFTVFVATKDNTRTVNSYHLTKFGRRFLEYISEE